MTVTGTITGAGTEAVTEQHDNVRRDTEHVEGARAVQRSLDRRDSGGVAGSDGAGR